MLFLVVIVERHIRRATTSWGQN